jgi:uncharacterized membrane protein YccC
MPRVEKGKQIRKKSKLKSFLKFSGKHLKEVFDQLDIKMAIKVTITALVSLYVCFAFDLFLKHPSYLAPGLWCVVSAIVVLQAYIGGTYKAIWTRFLGVVIGSAVGAFFAFKFGAEAMALGAAFFVTILLCSFLGIQESYRMASLSVAIIMIPWKLHPSSDPWIDAFFRFFDTCLGFVIAILISHILWPSQALTKMRLDMADICNLFRQFFEHLLIPDESLNKSHKISQSLKAEIEQAFTQCRSIHEESKIELLIRFAPGGVWLDLINCQERIWESLRALQNVFNSTLEEVFDEGLKLQVQHAVEVVDFALKELSIKLKTGQTNFDFKILDHLQKSLKQELIRFRATHTIKRYNINVVEDYFVFFYQLKQLLMALSQFHQLLNQIKLVKNGGVLED